MTTFILFIIGFIALVRGAEWLISGASTLARQLGVSDLIVGLTVVAFGTSLPELVVNLFAGGESGELAIGNIIGSNIANTLLILGIAAIIQPLSIQRTTVYREIVFNVGAALILGLLVSERFLSEGGFDGLDHIDGAILVSYFVIFLYYTFGRTRLSSTPTKATRNLSHKRVETIDVPRTMILIAAGAAGLWLGGQWIVDGAIEIATFFGVSDALIGLTIIAVGTSLPELAATIVAVRNKNIDIAVGNAVGSNLFNIFWVLGLSALINPLSFSDDLIIDVAINIVVALLLFGTIAVGKYRHQISRIEGRLFVSLYVIFVLFAVWRG